jgi:hypothetical protein
MDKDLYEKIKAKHGKHASWAIWPLEDLGNYEKVKEKINPNIVIMGRYIPGEIKEDFKNFHYPGYEDDTSSDGKLRFAFGDSEYKGAYMTNIIKYNKRNAPERENIKSLKEELEFIGSKNPLIIALGQDAFIMLKDNKLDSISKLICIYSHAFSGDGCSNPTVYRQKVWKMIKEQLPK